VLISVNPFKEIRGLYGEQAISSYRGRYMYELPPHGNHLRPSLPPFIMFTHPVRVYLRLSQYMH
jgi:hypothetical protein